MCIGPEGDLHGVSAAECAVRMAKAGSNVVGVNCHFDPFVSLQAYSPISKAFPTVYMLLSLRAFHVIERICKFKRFKKVHFQKKL